MTQVTFTVTLLLPVVDPTTLTNVAAEIEDELLSAGMEVQSVDPWGRPSLGNAELPPLAPPAI